MKNGNKILFLDIEFLKDSEKIWRIVKAKGLVKSISDKSEKLSLKIEEIKEFIVYPSKWTYTVNLFAYDRSIDIYVIEKARKNVLLSDKFSDKTFIILEDLFKSENKDIKDFQVSDLVSYEPPRGFTEFKNLFNIVVYFSNKNNLILDFGNANIFRESRIKKYFYSRDIINIDIPISSLHKGIRRLLSLDKDKNK